MLTPWPHGPIPCLIGPTASGKTALAIALAERHPDWRLVAISLDSAQVYRGLDIGAAKPAARELEVLPHRLLDLIEPEESYSVARALADVRTAVQDVLAEGGNPLLVGGTMLYYKALRDGLDGLPGCPPELRITLAQEAAERGWPALHSDLQQVDPETAARLEPADAQRISRALEVWRATGRRLSDWIAESKAGLNPDRIPPLPVQTLALLPEDRAWLHARLAQRFEAMAQQGLLEEVSLLRTRPGLRADHPSMRSVGYRQAWQHLEALDLDPTLASDRLWLQKGIEASRQLAKRQITWLRSFPEVMRLDPSGQPFDQIIRTAEIWLSSRTIRPIS